MEKRMETARDYRDYIGGIRYISWDTVKMSPYMGTTIMEIKWTRTWNMKWKLGSYKGDCRD